jgi:hypothetical protein
MTAAKRRRGIARGGGGDNAVREVTARNCALPTLPNPLPDPSPNPLPNRYPGMPESAEVQELVARRALTVDGSRHVPNPVAPTAQSHLPSSARLLCGTALLRSEPGHAGRRGRHLRSRPHRDCKPTSSSSRSSLDRRRRPPAVGGCHRPPGPVKGTLRACAALRFSLALRASLDRPSGRRRSSSHGQQRSPVAGGAATTGGNREDHQRTH